MPYTVLLKRQARKSIANLSRTDQARILDALAELETDPRPAGARMLHGQPELWRLRAGNYRIIYTVNDTALEVVIIRAAHRRDVYRGL